MKKISLFKRLLSGMAAAALAATICFGDRVFNDLFASAADQDPTVVVKVTDGGKASTYDAHTEGMKYFVLGALVDKDAAITEATAKYEKDIIAWDCLEIKPQEDPTSTVTFGKFYKNDNDPTKFDRDQQEVEYDPDKHKFIATVYNYSVTNQWGGAADNPHSTKGVEPTNLIAPEGEFSEWVWGQYYTYNEQSSTVFDGYVLQSSADGSTTTVTLAKHNVELYLRVNFSAPTTITADEYIYAVIEAERADGSKMYAVQQIITPEDDTNDADFVIYSKDVNNWTDANGTALNGASYTGEKTTARLFQSTTDRNIRQLLEGEGVAEIEDGGIAKAQIVDFKGQSNNGGKVTTKYYETINFLLADEADSYTFREILGSGIAFGITADRFALKSHMQTNLATNYYRDLLSNSADDGQNFDPDLSSPSAGEIYVANFANLTDPTDISIDKIRKMRIGDTKGATLLIHVTDKNRVEIHDPTGVTIDASMTAAQMTSTVVNPVIRQMQAMSNRLASKDATVTVIHAESRYVVNTLDYADDATIFVDGDALAVFNDKMDRYEFETEDIFRFIKKQDQTIVINFKNTDKVTINTFETTVYDKNGDLVAVTSSDGSASIVCDNADSSPDGARGTARNNFLDQEIMRKIVWNLNGVGNTKEEFKADEACVTIRNTAGIFLIPNAQTVTKIPSTSSGWLLSAGYVENNGGEWHFPYSDLDNYQAPKNKSIVVSKKSVTGEDELPGATIQIVDKVTGMNIGDTIWDYLIDENNKLQEGVEALKTDIDELKDVTYGMQWISGDKPRTVILRDGSYTLKEFGTTFISDDGKEYRVVTSSFDFEITNGVITKVSNDITEENGSIEYDDSVTDTITIRDAQIDGPQSYYVHINKTDVTGTVEIEGAKLSVYKANADGTKGELVKSRVSSKAEGSVWGLRLEPGDYILEETSDNGKEIVDADGRTYKIINSLIHFTVGEDGTVTSSDAKNDFDGKSGAVLITDENGDQTLYIADALNNAKVTINKTDISGQTEVDGAKLTITNKKTGEQVGETWTSKKGEPWEVDLEDGTYILTETGDTITDEDGNTYKVLPSTVEFTVHNGKVTSTQTVSSADDLDKSKGGVVLDGTNMTVCDAYKTVKVTIAKTDITGNAEINGAKLTITDKSGNVVKGPWTSGSNGKYKWEIDLAPGTYILKEEADSVVTDADGNKYQVIKTSYEFTVGEDGTVTESKKVSSDEGDISLKDGVITVVDALAPKTTKVKLDKTDVTGEKEIDNAEITITDEAGKVVRKWVSKIGKSDEFELEDGTYTLTEKAAEGKKVTDENGDEYEVIESSITFTVKDGKVTSKTSKTDFDETADSGYIVVKDNEITVCDAKKASQSSSQTSVSTSQSEVTTSQSEVTTPQSTVSTSQSEVTTSQSEVTTPQSTVSTSQSEVTTSQSSVSTPAGSVSSPSQSETTPSQSVSIPDSETTPSGSVSSSSQSETTPSQSVSTPSQSVSTPSQSETSPASSSVKPTSTSKSEASTEASTTTTKSTSDTDANTTTTTSKTSSTSETSSTTSATTDTQPTTTTSSGESTPQTGHTGSTVTVAALLAAVAGLAIFKKKDD